MLITIAIVVLFGILLMIVETFVPGGILGAFGLVCILTAVGLAIWADDFVAWPAWGRALLAFGILAVTATVMMIWLRCFSTRVFNRAFTLNATVPSPAHPINIAPGTEGTAITELRPLGRAEFAGQRCEVRCETGFAPAGSKVQVIATEPGNLVVRRL